MEKLIESIYKKAGVELNENIDESLNETYEDEDMFEDPQGILGVPGDEYTFSEIEMIYDWGKRDDDPSMQGYTSFEDWWKDTRGYLNRIIPIDESVNESYRGSTTHFLRAPNFSGETIYNRAIKLALKQTEEKMLQKYGDSGRHVKMLDNVGIYDTACIGGVNPKKNQFSRNYLDILENDVLGPCFEINLEYDEFPRFAVKNAGELNRVYSEFIENIMKLLLKNPE